jgi:hypothetical protein
VLEHGAQVLGVEQQQALVVGNLEHDLQHAGLRVVQVQHAPQQQRAEVGDRRAQGMALLAEHVPESDRAGFPARGVGLEHLEALVQLVRRCPGPGDPGQVALDIGHEHRHPDARQGLRDRLQGDRLAGAGRAGDAAVAVDEVRQQAQDHGRFRGDVLGDGKGKRHWALPGGKIDDVNLITGVQLDVMSRAEYH